MVVVGGAEDEVGGEREVVDPVGVGREGAGERSRGGVPDLDCFVMGRCVYLACTTPSHARDCSRVAA